MSDCSSISSESRTQPLRIRRSRSRPRGSARAAHRPCRARLADARHPDAAASSRPPRRSRSRSRATSRRIWGLRGDGRRVRGPGVGAERLPPGRHLRRLRRARRHSSSTPSGRSARPSCVDDFERERLTGLHLNSFTRQPFALVAANDTWSVVAQPRGARDDRRPVRQPAVAAAHPLDPRQRVKYLLEVCDPCQAVWYPVNGVPVSDFYMPAVLRSGAPRAATGTASPARSSARCRSSRAAT